MAPSTKWISTTLLPPSAISLGRLVADISDPQSDFQDTFLSEDRPDCPKVTASEIRADDYLHDAAFSRRWSLTAALTAVLGSLFSVQKDEVVSITADACTTRKLLNSGSYFDSACCSAAVRHWLERRWRAGRKAYIAVGVMTLHNARITLRLSNAREVGQTVALPGSVILLSATQGAVPTLGGLENVLDSEVGGSYGSKSHTEKSLSIQGENVLAIQYQQVDFCWFRKPTTRPVTLKTRSAWEAYLGSRGDDSEVESDEEDDDDASDDDGYVTLKAQVRGDVASTDVGDFNDYENFALNESEEIWHIF